MFNITLLCYIENFILLFTIETSVFIYKAALSLSNINVHNCVQLTEYGKNFDINHRKVELQNVHCASFFFLPCNKSPDGMKHYEMSCDL